MKAILTIIALFLFLSFGYGQQNQDATWQRAHAGIHKVVLKEVLQTPSYTYLLVQEENNKTQWLAVPKMEDAEIGETYFFQGGNVMKDFKSSTLNRTFESVLFLGGVVKAKKNEETVSTSSKVKSNKIDVSITPSENGITIAELFANKKDYEGKTVRIKGKVAQFSSGIMGKNWIHLQDGTEHEEKFDLVATTQMETTVGDTIELEGVITLDKDFGYGYFYEVIMEKSKVLP